MSETGCGDLSPRRNLVSISATSCVWSEYGGLLKSALRLCTYTREQSMKKNAQRSVMGSVERQLSPALCREDDAALGGSE